MALDWEIGERRRLVDGAKVAGEVVKRLLGVMHHLDEGPFEPIDGLGGKALARLGLDHHNAGASPLQVVAFLCAHFGQ